MSSLASPPPLWISFWMLLTTLIVSWALLNIVEILLAVDYLYLRHISPRDKRLQKYHAVAPLVGFAGAVMTASKTILYFLQEYLCGWCNVGHNDKRTFWMVWVIPNGTWIILPTIVSIVLGRYIAAALERDAIYSPASNSLPPAEFLGGKSDATLTEEPTQLSAALPLTFHPRALSVLIVGSNRLAATRALSFLEAEAKVFLLTTSEVMVKEVKELEESGRISLLQSAASNSVVWSELLAKHDISLACVTDTLISTPSRRSFASATVIYQTCLSLRIPINISDQPLLSTYTFPSVHRFAGADGPSHLQVAVSTNGQGCRMSGRIKREIVSKLPADVGKAVDNVGRLRTRAKARAKISEEDDGPLNTPVPQLSTPSTSCPNSNGEVTQQLSEEEQQLRRMRWVYQMSEYYSFEHLAKISNEEMDKALEVWGQRDEGYLPHHDAKVVNASEKKGRILLIGSGPGHPGLLTMAAHTALRTATLVLSDKLVPAEILALIPDSTKLHIAKKFPGNAEGAQNEMMELALEGAQRGETVVRLKQGDPFVYGRGGEEVLYFRQHGFESTVIPGISSALAAPLMMGIPVTQRGVAESLVLCTGVGRQGKAVQLPGYVRSRTLVMLMGVARISQIIEVLTSSTAAGRDGAAYPPHLPIAVIERASSPDQRVILSTLEKIQPALKQVDERPPGMMLVGWAALALEGKGRVDVLDRAEDCEVEMVESWLAEGQEGEIKGWKIREGLNDEWRGILNGII
ncbi:uroporphyrinogen-III C-methyltransferase [Cryptococcus deuterogattii 99/473]|uniref:precorrin-2 dehydrogenase n=1 Tax=Cryptococcus deuterogattii Ram5 TaxID=1296110 RepID=A0A0D0UY66_9TREE|nr:uroporphyrinogen-III C-methyltransferase [Cryptococcus deuterogattii Ram5]KIY58999.1 uroporphyrinogen-III C-methyltransferase [Cryptococcus deuterogattii 99/473]